MNYNEKSKANLVPFEKGYDPRRQIGRKKGSLNRRTIIKSLLNDDLSPDMIFSLPTRERIHCMSGKSYLEAITMTLINQSLDGNHQASNILLRELRKIDEEEPRMPFGEMRKIEIVVVDPET